MTNAVDFDALSKKAIASNVIEDLNDLFGSLFALPQWHFIARGQFPNVHPYIASNAQVAGGQDMVRAFTDTDRLMRFVKENGLVGPDGKADHLVLSLPTATIVEYLEQFIPHGVHGIWFNSDSASDGFFAPLKQLRPIQDFLKSSL